jgi:hypothetical protein
MKKTIILVVPLAFTIFFWPCEAAAQSTQGGFIPNSVGLEGSIGSVLKFTTKLSFFIPGSSGAYGPYFVGSPGVTFISGPISGYGSLVESEDVTVFVNTDSIDCLIPPEAGLFAYVDSNQFLAGFYLNVYIYDPKIVGRVSLNSDTLNFGTVPLGDSMPESVYVSIDTLGSIYRILQPLNVQVPFSPPDSVAPSFGGCSVWVGDEYFYFKPTEIRKYVDTTYLYDPIRKDSTMLILIGEGVAANVGNSGEGGNRIAISPNPCDKHCTLSITDGQIEHVIVRNLLGESVLDISSLHNDEFSISTASFPNGIYFIEARSNENIYRERVIVAH